MSYSPSQTRLPSCRTITQPRSTARNLTLSPHVLSWMTQNNTSKERIETLRAQAKGARRLAGMLSRDADQRRLLAHAEELEETATRLEQQAPGDPAR